MENMEDEVIVEEFEEEMKSEENNVFLEEAKSKTEIMPEKKYNKVVYCLLAWFLGIWGAHSFYAGKNKQGIIFVVTTVLGFILLGGIPLIIEWIICIVQIIKAVKKPADEYGRIS